MDFIALDVETANPDMASICQIGIAKYKAGELREEWTSYVDPQDYFDPLNISVHGIDESTVEGAPTFPDALSQIQSWLEGSVLVCHTHFDRASFHQASEKHGVRLPATRWLDSARVTRRTWKQFAWKGYGLHNVCDMLGYHFKHHDALEDAKAAAYVFLAACHETGLDIEGWLERVERPIDLEARSRSKPITRDGNPEGHLFGEVLVFTGALDIPRREAADHAASVGCYVAENVSKKTTLLVVGDQDVRKLAGHKKSSKHRKAEKLIADGVPIRILRETDFRRLLRLCETPAEGS
jgi:DNA polymerase III subunit epsilon